MNDAQDFELPADEENAPPFSGAVPVAPSGPTSDAEWQRTAEQAEGANSQGNGTAVPHSRAKDAPRMPQERRFRREAQRQDERQSARGSPKSDETRISPHNIDAEQGVLGAILLPDGAEILAKAIAGGLRPESFYVPKHQVIFEAILGLEKEGGAVDELLLANALGKAGRLDAIGGHSYLYELTNRIQTTVHAMHWMAVIQEKFTQRQIIRVSQMAIEAAHSAGPGDAMEVLENARRGFERVAGTNDENESVQSFADFPLEKFNPNNLLGNDWLQRGDQFLLNSNAGTGKSSFIMQSAAKWALGKPMMGIFPARPLDILIIQAEDSERYLAKCAQSIRQGLGLCEEEWSLVNKKIKVKELRGCPTQVLLRKIKTLGEKYQPDIIFINPISNYIEGDLSDPVVTASFFNGLEEVNPLKKWAYFLVHHTGKPAKTEKDNGQDPAAIYMGYGNSVLANRPRASMNLAPRRDLPGRFYLHLGKGCNNAGVTREVPHGMGVRMEPTRRIALKYSEQRLKLEWGEIPMVLWEPDEDDGVDDAPETKAKGGRSSKYSDADILSFFPSSAEASMDPSQIRRKMDQADFKLYSGSMFHFIKKAIKDGLVMRVPHPKGDKFYRV